MPKLKSARAQISAQSTQSVARKKDAKLPAQEQSGNQTASLVTEGNDLSVTPGNIIQFQRLIGNQATLQMLDQKKRTSRSVQRLPDQLEGTMGKVFGDSLSGVNIHTDAHANEIARAADTKATTIGQDIYFQAGAYRPGTADGNALIAREVAHIQHAKVTGSEHAKPSSEATGSAKQDANMVADIVQSMGANPAQILQPISKQPTAAQRQVLQRADGKKRAAGIIASKVVQGVFTTVLGPVGLLWRWPLIQKNLGEATGWDKTGSRPGKKEDRMRYGEGALGTTLRWIYVISEFLKEFTIWLGFGTFIAAIVAAATHGAAAPVFAGLLIATAVTAGLHMLMRGALVAGNLYRLRKEKRKGTSPADLAYIKAQLVSDGMEGISAGLTAILSSIGAGGVGSVGGSLANAAGYGSADASSKLVGSGMTMATSGLAQNVVGNSLKEGGKEAVKPDTKTTGFFGKGSKTKDDWGGFGKDAVEIKNAYGGYAKAAKDKKKADEASNQQWQVNPGYQGASVGATLSPDAMTVLGQVDDVQQAAARNTVDQSAQSVDAQEQQSDISKLAPQVKESSSKVSTIDTELKQTGEKGQAFQSQVPKLVEESVGNQPGKLEDLTAQTNKGLETASEAKIQQTSNAPTNDEGKIDMARVTGIQRDGVGSSIKGWFVSKLSGLKSGVTKLNNKILKGVLKFASKFSKSEEDRKTALKTIDEEAAYSAQIVQEEKKNDASFAEYQAKAGQLSQGAHQLAEMEKQ